MGQNKSKEKLANQVKKVLNDWWHQVQANPILYALIFFFVMSIVSLDNILGTLQQTNINFTGAIWFGSLLLLSWLVLLRTAKQPRPVQVMTAGAVSLLIFFCIAESIRFLIRHQALSAKIWETGTFWTLAALLISSPVAFVVWRFRDENQSKDINLKEFQKISEWVTGAHFQEEKHSEKFSGSLPENADTAQPSERSREYYRPAASAQAFHTFSKQDGAVGLQIAAVYNLLPFYRGDYGQAFEKPSVHLLHSAWKVLQHDILRDLDNADDDKMRKDLINKLHQRADSPLGQAITRVLLACDYAKKPLLHRHLEILPGICLSGMDFNLAGLETEILRDTLFCGQDLTGAQWQGVRMQDKNNQDEEVHIVELTIAGYEGQSHEESEEVGQDKNEEIVKWNLTRAKFKQANLFGAELNWANLSETDFESANLSSVQLNYTTLYKTQLYEVNLSNAKLDSADLSSATLSRTNLSSVELDNADLSNAKLINVNLSGLRLDGVILSNAVFSKVNLSDVDFSAMDLSGTRFEEVSLFNIKYQSPPEMLATIKTLEGSLIDCDSFSKCKNAQLWKEQLKEKGLIILYCGNDTIPNFLFCKHKTKLEWISSHDSSSIPFKIDLAATRAANPDWEISIFKDDEEQ